MLYTVKQQKANTTKTSLLSLRQKTLNQVFVQVTREITVNTGDTNKNDTYVAFGNCAQFSTYKTEIKGVFIDKVNHVDIAMSMYNLIEYSNNYSDKSGSLWQFKRDKIPAGNGDVIVDNGVFTFQSYKYTEVLVGKAKDY